MRYGSPALQAALDRARVTRDVVVERGALDRLPEIYARQFGDRPFMVIADANTFEAAGRRADAVLRRAGISSAEALVLPGRPRLKPRREHAEHIRDVLVQGDSVPVAVGAGVVNDLTRYAAAQAGRPYLSVPTAASMDGYAASGAPLIDDGFKRTLPCDPALAIVADLDVVAMAPGAMAGWGYGDLAGKVVAGMDWVLADAIGEEPIDPGPFETVHSGLRDWLSDPPGIAAGDRDAIAGLMTGLLVSGFAIQAHGGSRPASGSEHQFAHLWEMEGLTVNGVPAAHGACVGIGTVAMLAAYAWLLDRDITAEAVAEAGARRPDLRARRHDVKRWFPNADIRESAWAEVEAKHVSPARFRDRLDAFKGRWPDLRARLREMLVPPETMQTWLAGAGAVSHFGQLGLAADRFAADHARAQCIRRRYTVLDVLTDLGWLEKATGNLFARGGFWNPVGEGRAPGEGHQR